jgi:phosphoribosyl 1,2-cyclic phosphodiesterase
MQITYWGTRGSIAAAGQATQRYGGNTASVQVTGRDGTVVILDAGTGIREIADALPPSLRRIDIFLSHLHMDHIQGLGFFAPMFQPSLEVHLWGPPSATLDLRSRLTRYLSPPLFPIRLRDLSSHVELHNAPDVPVRVGGLVVTASAVIHPGPTLGYRIAENRVSMAYLPDHEPALGDPAFPGPAEWTSGFDLARGVDVLIHDTQYFPAEREPRVGWGHSATTDAARFALLTEVKRLDCFHHDPGHDDETIDRLVAEVAAATPGIEVTGAREGSTIEL